MFLFPVAFYVLDPRQADNAQPRAQRQRDATTGGIILPLTLGVGSVAAVVGLSARGATARPSRSVPAGTTGTCLVCLSAWRAWASGLTTAAAQASIFHDNDNFNTDAAADAEERSARSWSDAFGASAASDGRFSTSSPSDSASPRSCRARTATTSRPGRRATSTPSRLLRLNASRGCAVHGADLLQLCRAAGVGLQRAARG